MIQGVVTKTLEPLRDDRGFLMEMLRSDDSCFEQFGQVYMTGCKRGVVKGWHYHKLQTDNFICVYGRALVVLYDPRDDSPTQGVVEEYYLESPPTDSPAPMLLQIPPLVFHGFTSADCDEARIINVPTLPYRYDQPDEYRCAWNSDEIPYRWPPDVVTGG